MITAKEVVRKATWLEHYSPGRYSLNLCNVFDHLSEPYRIAKVRKGYTVMLAETKIGTFATFEDAIVGCYEHADSDCAFYLFGPEYVYEHTARRAA